MATKVAIEVDVKTGDASDEIISLREELEKVKAAQQEMTKKIEAGFKASEKGAGLIRRKGSTKLERLLRQSVKLRQSSR
jgi:predicted nucleotide-binding protein (sugar kinase/HSP70/actin superfamily)